MTNFFEQQQAARRRTTRLLILYYVAVLLTVAVSVAATVLILWAFALPSDDPFSRKKAVLDIATIVGIAIAVAVVQGTIVLGASWYKTAELSAGGKAVALLLGGQEVLAQTRNPAEKRLLNIVEEMAIASGVPVPAVFVLENEPGINAFAAGHTPGDAVVAVSRGALTYLTRDELQGVVAHEFSHILNGDMSINLKLIGWIFGLIALSLVGQTIVRALSRTRSSGSKKDGGGLILAFFLIGLALWLLGLVGSFFGNLIKAMVSRQREYLADASAVQFTRNPDGIGGALKKIGGLAEGGAIKNEHAPEASHLFFAEAVGWMSLFATHPPLADRIRRIDPHWDGTYPEVKPVQQAEPEPKRKPAGRRRVPFPIPTPVASAALAGVVDRVGTPTPEQTAEAAEIIEEIPQTLHEAVEEPFAARALVYCLTLGVDAEVRAKQLAFLRGATTPAEQELVARLLPQVDELSEAYWLSLLDRAVPALRRMSPEQYAAFRKNLDALVRADARLSTFEYVLYCVLERYLDPAFGRWPRRVPAPSSAEATRLVAEVLSLVAWEGAGSPEEARAAHAAGLELFLNGQPGPALAPREACTIEGLDERLRRLSTLPPADRKRILMAVAACVAADGKATVREVELYRAVGDVLGCPVPPLPVPTAA